MLSLIFIVSRAVGLILLMVTTVFLIVILCESIGYFNNNRGAVLAGKAFIYS